jgi:hypothetical protein
LVKRDALGVDANEDLGDLFLIDVGGKLESGEWIALKVVKAVDGLDQLVLFLVRQLTSGAEPLDEPADESIA